VPALITELIDRPDTFERVRDQIAAILLVESQAQQALAALAGKDPKPWKLRVFMERANPWDVFQDPPDASAPAEQLDFDYSPLVNVAFDNDSFDKSKGNVVSQQRADGVFNLDIYGYGASADDGALGHIAGDQVAALEAARGVRLVRSILLAGAYVNLGMRGVVADRWVGARTSFRPVSDSKPAQHVEAMRLQLQVSYNEFAPQVTGPLLLTVGTSITRADTGEVFLSANFPLGA